MPLVWTGEDTPMGTRRGTGRPPARTADPDAPQFIDGDTPFSTLPGFRLVTVVSADYQGWRYTWRQPSGRQYGGWVRTITAAEAAAQEEG